MLRVTNLAGQAGDPALADRLHELEHQGRVETVRLSRADMARRRQSVRSDRGTELALLLDRDAALANGSVLLLEPGRAVVVALDEPEWLVLHAADAAHALALGYFAGNMHWKVRFDGERLCIALEGPRDDYLARMSHLLQGGGIVAEPAGVPMAFEAGAEPVHLPAHGHGHGHLHHHHG
jgi:urease accessory protein